MQTRSRRQMLASTALVVPLLLVGSAADAQDRVVTFRSWSPIVDTTAKMIEAFEAGHPGIKVESNIFNYPEYIVDLQTRSASDALADIVGLEPGALTQQYRDSLIPLQDCAVQSWGENWQEQFFPLAIDQARLGNPEGDENFYGLPVLTQTINLWYTIPIFEEAGVEPPKTFDEMVEVAKVFNDLGLAPLMHGAADGWQRRDIYMQLIHNIAPGLIYEAEVGNASFTEAPFVEAMAFWKRLFDEEIVQPGALGVSAYPGTIEAIEGGRAAMFPMGAWWQQQAANANPSPLSQGLSGFAPFKFPDVTGAVSRLKIC